MAAVASPQVIGRYTIYGKIASGGMASVHFGRLRGGAGFARTVAIKRLHPHLAEDNEFRATLIDEARLAARIHHPNVVPTLDVVSEDGELLLIMEYVCGESLSSLLKIAKVRGRRVPLPIVSAIAVGALLGLHAAHEARTDRGTALGIVHRDVSPQNILVGVDGLARVIDFGVAKAAGRLQTTQEGTLKGKIAYMAPEQIATGDVTRSADVYAMGVILWEMLAGRRLFAADNEGNLVANVLAGMSELPSRHAPNLPAGLDALVTKAVSPSPANRFATAHDMAEILLRLVPPALPTDVGRWVTEAASSGLRERAARLADIESASGMAAPSPLASAPESGQEELKTKSKSAVAPLRTSQPSSLSVEAPRLAVARRGRSGRNIWMLALGGGGLLTLGLAAGVWGRGTAPRAPRNGAAAIPVTVASFPAPSALGPASAQVATEDAMAPESLPPYTPQSAPIAALRPPGLVQVAPPASPSAPSTRPGPGPIRPRLPASPAPSCTVATSFDSDGQPHFKKVCK